MKHEEYVRIARSGEGAIVAELMRLDSGLIVAKDRIEKLQNDLADALDREFDLNQKIQANDARTSAHQSLAMAELADELDKIACAAGADITRLDKQYDSKISNTVDMSVCQHGIKLSLNCQLCREGYRPNSGNEIDPRRG